MTIPTSAAEFIAGQADLVRRLSRRKRIVFPEGDDPRVRRAAAKLAADNLIEPILIEGPAESDPKDYWRLYYERRRAKGITEIEAREIAQRPLYRAALMLAAGEADGFVGGAANTTAETLRAALHCVGPHPSVKTVSSSFVVAVHNRSYGHHGLILFADCGIIIDPSAAEMAEIAIASAATARALFRCDPAVAMLSFSTKGSAKHPFAEKVIEAVRIVRARAPEINVDGEMQADAALVASVGESKAPGSPVAGRANILVFPDLASANIAVKLVERLGGAVTLGPIVQGLAKPANDLSRGCSADDVYSVALITALQSELTVG
jgi:phosphate acetyltransferase